MAETPRKCPEKTPLNGDHRARGAVLIEFHGWEMPVRYTTIPEEHRSVREHVGLFDLCHMGRLEIRGPDRIEWLQRVLTADVATIAPGRARYSFVLNDAGTIIDDTILYQLADASLLVVNASNRAPVIDWMNAHRGGLNAQMTDRTYDWAMIALQGPAAAALLPQVVDSLDMDLSALKYYAISSGRIGGRQAWIARTGYTGENGFEVYLDAADALEFWRRTIEMAGENAAPIGLGARDTLRLEAGMPLYGNDIDDSTDPYEAQLGFAVKLDKEPPFLGRDALVERRKAVDRQQLCGFRIDSRRVARQGMAVLHSGETVGRITSGAPSPTLGCPIAMGYVPARLVEAGVNEFFVDVRGRHERLVRQPLPFYSRVRKK